MIYSFKLKQYKLQTFLNRKSKSEKENIVFKRRITATCVILNSYFL